MTRETANVRCTKRSAGKQKFVPPSENEIAFYAFAIYAQENPRRAFELWQEAEAQLIADRQHDAGLLRSPEMFRRN